MEWRFFFNLDRVGEIMDLNQLVTFCTIITNQNMTTAAERLKLTQPSVSRQIKMLEAELGVRLLERGKKGIVPTIQGQILFDYARKILNLVKKAETMVQSVPQHLEGRLRVSTMNYLGMSLISPVILAFLKNPNNKFKIELSYGHSKDIIEKMKKSEIEVVVMPNLKKEYGVSFDHYETYPLFRDEMLFVGSRKDFTFPRSLKMKDLNEKPFISFSDILPQFQLYFEKKQKEAGVEIQPIFEVNNLGTMKKAIETNGVYGFMPRSSIRKQLHLRRLSVVDVEDFKYEVDIEIYGLKNFQNQKLIEILLTMLTEQAHIPMV